MDTDAQLTITLQKELDTLPDGSSKLLPAGEYQGPLIINRAITLEGQIGTDGRPTTCLWVSDGPVLIIQSSQVVLRNLNIEVTGNNSSPEAQNAILVRPRRTLSCYNIETYGGVAGLPEEKGLWDYPRTLHLGRLSPDKAHTLLIKLEVPVACQVISNRTELKVEPQSLHPGFNQLQLTVDPFKIETLLEAVLLIVTNRFTRTIELTAHIFNAPQANL
jgi:hypothetical protein